VLRFVFISAVLLIGAALPCALPSTACAAVVAERLTLDAVDAPNQVWHASLAIPVTPADGEVTLVFPQWKPGNHAPTGQVANLGMLRATAGGSEARWTRDPNDLYTFHFAVPAQTTELDLAYDVYEGTPSGGDMSAHIGILDWNQVVFAPLHAAMRDVTVAAQIALPPGWTAATALPPATPAAPFAMPSGTLQFAPVTLETLIDSPLYCGAYERVVPLTSADGMTNEVDLFGESPADIDPTAAEVERWKRLVAQADRLFGGRHWRHYHFLLSLSDTIPPNGVEHHESSADRLPERYLSDPNLYRSGADLLPHEYTHSWNGKYRRPAGLITDTFQQPEDTELLWVYEGLTEYFGQVLTARSTLGEPGAFEDVLAENYAQLDVEPGHRTRPLGDTTKMQVINRVNAGSYAFSFERRGADYYPEGVLLWLDADTLIRQRSHGRRSLDDFAQRFFGGPNVPGTVVGYTRADLITALDAVLPYDWAAFFAVRVDAVLPHPELAGITRGGWQLVYTSARSDWQIRQERDHRWIDATSSLGGLIAADGSVSYTIDGLPLAQAGIAGGSKILGVDGLTFSPQRLRLAIGQAQMSRAPIAFIVDDAGVVRSVDVDYHGGERYPHLVRDAARPDVLAAITAPVPARAASR
jgi:predicted metalloprotease with PDZ domain